MSGGTNLRARIFDYVVLAIVSPLPPIFSTVFRIRARFNDAKNVIHSNIGIRRFSHRLAHRRAPLAVGPMEDGAPSRAPLCCAVVASPWLECRRADAVNTQHAAPVKHTRPSIVKQSIARRNHRSLEEAVGHKVLKCSNTL